MQRAQSFNDIFRGRNWITGEFQNWLISAGFFKAPASIHHHGAYPGALFDHSLAVMNALLDLANYAIMTVLELDMMEIDEYLKGDTKNENH